MNPPLPAVDFFFGRVGPFEMAELDLGKDVTLPVNALVCS
jgi:hypothetical protein